MIIMKCQKCNKIYSNILYGKGLICSECGYYTKNAIIKTKEINDGLVKRQNRKTIKE